MAVEWMSGEPVDLTAPVMLVAFEGWNDAADVATNALEHLELDWGGKPIAAIRGDEFYNYLEQRPRIRITDGVTRGLEYPEITITQCRPAGLAQDVLLVRGPEPSLRWETFTDAFIAMTDELDVSQVVLLGAFLSDAPHTRPTPLTGSAYSKERAAIMGVEPTNYSGPTGITGVLQQEFTTIGIPTISLWASVPHYVASPPNPRATQAMLRWLSLSLGLPTPHEDLEPQVTEWLDRVNAAAAEDDDLADYIRSLEEQADSDATVATGPDPEPDRTAAAGAEKMRLVDGEAIAEEFERYLRGDSGPGHGH